jgi:hypothetical protein
MAAIQLLESLATDRSVEIVLLTNDLYRQAFNLFKQRQDKEWGLGASHLCKYSVIMRDTITLRIQE